MVQFIIKSHASLKTKDFESNFIYHQWIFFSNIIEYTVIRITYVPKK